MPKKPASIPQAALSELMLASAGCVREVLDGRSLTESLAAVPAPLRAAVQAIAFYVMRRLGLAMQIRRMLVKRIPSKPLLDALLLVSLALLDAALRARTATAQAGPESVQDTPTRAGEPPAPLYAVHTVVDQAVQAAAGRRDLQAGKGLINAVLRRYVREYEAVLPQALQNPQARWNHPEWWVWRLEQAYPQQWQALLEAAGQAGPLVLRVNRRKATVEQVVTQLEAVGLRASKQGGQAVVVEPPRPVAGLPGFTQGWWSVQDGSAQQAAVLLQPFEGARVLDACAAPGGKTAHLLELADIELLALDHDAQRLERVRENLDRLGLWHDGVSLRCADAARLDDWWDGRPFDLVLADVPCTASGVLRRHPDIRWLRRESDIERTAALQREILTALWRTVKPGGRLLYATCSVFPEEGEQQAQWFVEQHADARRLGHAVSGGSGGQAEGGLAKAGLPVPGQILPLPRADGQPPGDGFFYALFVKHP